MTGDNIVEKNVEYHIIDIMHDIVDKGNKLWHKILSHLNLRSMRKISSEKIAIKSSRSQN